MFEPTLECKSMQRLKRPVGLFEVHIKKKKYHFDTKTAQIRSTTQSRFDPLLQNQKQNQKKHWTGQKTTPCVNTDFLRCCRRGLRRLSQLSGALPCNRDIRRHHKSSTRLLTEKAIKTEKITRLNCQKWVGNNPDEICFFTDYGMPWKPRKTEDGIVINLNLLIWMRWLIAWGALTLTALV